MAKAPINLARSVKDRLLNIARAQGRVFDVVLVRFALERLLYRLSISEHKERFVLKGGMLVAAWLDDDNRVTRDADFLGHGDASAEKLIADFHDIVTGSAGDPDLDRFGELAAFAGVRQFPQRVKCAMLGWRALEQALLQGER